jgi:N-acyl homoserine lactone hydrolase
MKTRFFPLAGLALAVSLLQACTAGLRTSDSGVQRVYVLNCGEGVAGDISRWSPGVNAGKSMDFVDNCYLIRHAQGWMLWDTGVADSVAAMPEGLAPSDPRAVHWKKPRTLAAQLQEIGVRPAEVRYVGVSHSHADHSGNVGMFPGAMLLVQRAEYDWPQASGPRFPMGIPVTKLEGDRDVFGDGSVIVMATPGHTPGHQSLLFGCREPATCCCPAMRCISARTGRRAGCPRPTSTRRKAVPRCSASPIRSRAKRRCSGSITTRHSATD